MKIAIIVSGGGHLDEALAVIEAFKGHEVILISYKLPSLVSYRHPALRKVYFVSLAGSSGVALYFNFLLNFFQFLFIFLKERPKVLFSTGSEITVIPFFLGKIFFGSRLIFLETLTRVKNPSFTARMVYAITDLFLVQWESLLSMGPKARFAGRII